MGPSVLTNQKKPRLVVILGPTAVGKTALAIQLAEKLEGEIISADSRLFYRGMDIGTAKPTFEERRRVPHHLIDVAAPDETWSLTLFQSAARQVIAEVVDRGKLPFLVGGTGQYLQAVLEDWQPPELKPNEALRKVLQAWAEEITPEGLHHRLAKLDPVSAARIDPRNIRRTIRALEVTLLSGRRFSDQRRSGEKVYHPYIIGVMRSREELYARIDRRVDQMIQNGFVAEVRTLLDQGYSSDLPALSAIGYREICAYLHGESTLENAVKLIKRKTRVFVRRQANWFKIDNPEIHWYPVQTGYVTQIETGILSWLNEPGPAI